MKAFYKHMSEMLAALDDCAAKCRLMPCLTLLYSGMDVMASLDADGTENNRTDFVKWVDAFLLEGRDMECTSLDLYAARCGIVHAYHAGSRLYEEGKAKKISYAWGLGKLDDLRRGLDASGHREWRSVHMGDLIFAFKEAIANHLEHIENDAAASQRFQEAVGLWFGMVDGNQMSEYLAILDSEQCKLVIDKMGSQNT